MEIEEALAVIRKLADGVHPDSGATLPADNLYQHPQAVRAMHRAMGALEFQAERERPKNSFRRTRVKLGLTRKIRKSAMRYAGAFPSSELPKSITEQMDRSLPAWCVWVKSPPGRKCAERHSEWPIDLSALCWPPSRSSGRAGLWLLKKCRHRNAPLILFRRELFDSGWPGNAGNQLDAEFPEQIQPPCAPVPSSRNCKCARRVP
jgi:hypothetical protein